MSAAAALCLPVCLQRLPCVCLCACSDCPVSVCVSADRRGSSVCPQLSKRGSWDESGGRPPSLGHGSAGQRRNNSVGGGAGKPWTASKSPDTLSPASSLDSVLNHSQVRLFLCLPFSHGQESRNRSS